MTQAFSQAPPALGNQYRDDRVLLSYLKRTLPPETLRAVEPALIELGALAGGELYRMQLADRLNEPELVQWDPWGQRIDRVEVSPLWRTAEKLAVKYGLVATAYDTGYGRFARVVQCALVYLFHPSTDVYTCPLAMADGAARTLIASGNRALIRRAVPRLTSRNPKRFWTSGQWMTELTGGSDVGASETLAERDATGQWRLWGRKWFVSAVTSPMALTLARPCGNPPGGRGLALFYLEPRDADGRWRNIEVNRLKDKLGTRKVATAELALNGTPALLVCGESDGVRNIIPMLTVTRLWNSVTAVAFMRRGLALARDYARRRAAFGKPLAEQPLHLDTLAGLQAEMEGAFHLAFFLVELLGREEAGEIDPQEGPLLRLLSSMAKLTTARQTVAVASEILEAFGGAGYVEDTGLPLLLRDSQAFSIWEGATNVLALDVLRAVENTGAPAALREKLEACRRTAREPQLETAAQEALAVFDSALSWHNQARRAGDEVLQAGARRFALTLGRATELALLADHAQWSLDREQDGRARAAALRLARSGIDLLFDSDPPDAMALAMDIPLQPGPR